MSKNQVCGPAGCAVVGVCVIEPIAGNLQQIRELHSKGGGCTYYSCMARSINRRMAGVGDNESVCHIGTNKKLRRSVHRPQP